MADNNAEAQAADAPRQEGPRDEGDAGAAFAEGLDAASLTTGDGGLDGLGGPGSAEHGEQSADGAAQAAASAGDSDGSAEGAEGSAITATQAAAQEGGASDAVAGVDAAATDSDEEDSDEEPIVDAISGFLPQGMGEPAGPASGFQIDGRMADAEARNAAPPVAVWTAPATALQVTLVSLASEGCLPPGLVGWAVGMADSEQPSAGSYSGSSIDFHMRGQRYLPTSMPGKFGSFDGSDTNRPYVGAWGTMEPPTSAAAASKALGLSTEDDDAQTADESGREGEPPSAVGSPADVPSGAGASADAASKAESDASAGAASPAPAAAAGSSSNSSGAAAAEAAESSPDDAPPRWLTSRGRARIDTVLDIIVQPVAAGTEAAAEAVAALLREPGAAPGRSPSAADVAAAMTPPAAARPGAGAGASVDTPPGTGAGTGSGSGADAAHPSPDPMLSPRPALGVMSVHGHGTDDHADGHEGAQATSLTLTRLLIKPDGDGCALLAAAPREATASLLRVFSPHSRGSFHHACTVLQRLVLAHPHDVAEALVALGPAPLRRLMAFLHHPPVADTLIQLLTLEHTATAQGGAGPSAGAGGGGGAMAMFGGPPRDDQLGALFAQRPASDRAPVAAQALIHAALAEWRLLPELARHVTTYGVGAASWGPEGMFDVEDAASPASAGAGAGAGAGAAAGAGAGAGTVASSVAESDREAEDAVRGGDEDDDPVANAILHGADATAARAAAEAAHVSAAADALIECVRMLREQGPTSEQALAALSLDTGTVRGLVEAACGSSIAPNARVGQTVQPGVASSAAQSVDGAADAAAAAAAAADSDASAAASSGSPGAAPGKPASSKEPLTRPAGPGECTGATARALAAVRCLRALLSMSFEEHLPAQAAGIAGMPRVLRHNPLRVGAQMLTTRTAMALPRLVAHLARLQEAIHPQEAEKLLQLAARARNKAKKRAKRRKNKKAAAPAAAAAAAAVRLPGAPRSALPVVPVSPPNRRSNYGVAVPFGEFRLEASRLLADFVDYCPSVALDRMVGEAAKAALKAHIAEAEEVAADGPAAGAADSESADGEPDASSADGAAAAAGAGAGAGVLATASSAESTCSGADGADHGHDEDEDDADGVLASLAPPAALEGWSGPGVWGALVCWAVQYPHCDSFHRVLERLVRQALVVDHRPTVERLLVGCRMVPVMMTAALGDQPKRAGGGSSSDPASSSGGDPAASVVPRTPLRALALRLLGMLRLVLQSKPRSGHYLSDYLGSNPVWQERLPELERELLEQRRDCMPRPPSSNYPMMAGLPPAVAAMLAAMQARNARSSEEEAKEKRIRESIDLGGALAEQLGLQALVQHADSAVPKIPTDTAPGATAGGAVAAEPPVAPSTSRTVAPPRGVQPPSLPAPRALTASASVPTVPASASARGSPEEDSDSEAEGAALPADSGAGHQSPDASQDDAEEGKADKGGALDMDGVD
ncbi:hypothetical protein FNF27_04113 [Cafeteria roenbergensis]|uniref:Uncharacterized protein n=1 Tax=Cafeteria roenbergensis TaxID=33653 RepID=A0A5A8EEP6_CAFRO|nr:hypothetical protein FNF27_04113 [Cafeteria roenbergensis]